MEKKVLKTHRFWLEGTLVLNDQDYFNYCNLCINFWNFGFQHGQTNDAKKNQ